ncbi:MAG: DUF4405 domain-containing protein [Thermodesulfobacteriota bacterium]|nr:DUF4405 domain-containing protein [Thermodesulfobacteriota bacterium]
MKIRRITSLTAFLSFFVMLLTSVVLYIAPQGRVAYWADWRLWGLSKDQWGGIHINTGFLFLFALLLHMYYNWTAIMLYLKKAKQLKVFTKELNLALILTAAVVAGTYAGIPPFSSIIRISDHFKAKAAEKYGEPPYGHAELSSIKIFTQKMGVDLDTGIRRLEKAGFRVDNEMQTLQSIAKANGVSPQQLYMIMSRTANGIKKTAEGRSLPASPVPGTGNLTLADFCSQYDLNIKRIRRYLKERGLAATGEMTIKEIGETNKMAPADVYEHIKSIAADKP